jgi:outer membrane protein assembly factor BamB
MLRTRIRSGVPGLGWVFGVALLASACTGPNRHAGLKPDETVLSRDWTLSTRDILETTGRGYEYSNPVVFENTLVFGSRSLGLAALYPGLQQYRWTLPIEGGVVSEILVEKGVVYFGGGDGYLYAVQAENGRVIWRLDVHGPIVSRPTLDGGRLFVTTADDTVYALDAATKKWLWHYRRRTAGSATVRGASSPWVDSGEVLVGLSDGFLVALNAADGSLKWERKLHQGSKFTDVDARPVLDQGVLYVPSYDGALYALKRQGGEILWRFDAGGSRQVVVEGERLYLPSSDGSVYALQKSNAKVIWKFEMDGGTPTQLTSTDRHLIFGSSYQYLYVVEKATGRGVYRFNSGWGSGFTSTPALDPEGKKLYLLSSGGNLMAFRYSGSEGTRRR